MVMSCFAPIACSRPLDISPRSVDFGPVSAMTAPIQSFGSSPGAATLDTNAKVPSLKPQSPGRTRNGIDGGTERNGFSAPPAEASLHAVPEMYKPGHGQSIPPHAP